MKGLNRFRKQFWCLWGDTRTCQWMKSSLQEEKKNHKEKEQRSNFWSVVMIYLEIKTPLSRDVFVMCHCPSPHQDSQSTPISFLSATGDDRDKVPLTPRPPIFLHLDVHRKISSAISVANTNFNFFWILPASGVPAIIRIAREKTAISSNHWVITQRQ